LLQLRAKIAASFEIFAILGNVQSGPQVTRVMRNFSIQTVYHAAAYKHVPLVEHNAVEGVRNNVFGTLRVAEAAIACGVTSLILVSTDKAVRPTNLMGASKRLAEIVCQTLAVSAKSTTVSMVRFGNVLGSSGSVIPLFKRQIAAGGPITVTHPEITRFFMTMTEAAQLVIQAGAMARGGEVFVLDMGEPIRIAELATQMVRLHGKKPVLVSSISDGKMVGSGEIGIAFTHLRPGEKLYEELLIGNNPTATAHTRIMSAAEPCLSATALCPLLDALTAACDANDIPEIQSLMLRAQTAYTPAKDIVDYDWIRQSEQNTQPGRPNADSPYLSLVR
jgi:FlaA1/EpsC-like NDP-sugar epimerase